MVMSLKTGSLLAGLLALVGSPDTRADAPPASLM